MLIGACAAGTPAPRAASDAPADGWQRSTRDGVTLAYREPDAALAPELLEMLARGRRAVEQFFGTAYPAPFTAFVYPDRDSLTAHWRQAWSMPELETQCWMVASGEADALTLLSPRVWTTQACEHDPANLDRTQALITHELVHVFHGQQIAGRSFDGMDEAGWFVEGLAAYASGQLELGYLAPASEAIARGKAPTRLTSAWSGAFRYGVCGSIVGWIDRRIGRPALLAALRLRSTPEILTAIDLTESELLDQWKASVAGKEATVSLTPPWTIDYHDGAGNGYRIWADDAGAHYEYTPVTPAESSSGSYSGGTPARGDLTADQVAEIWQRIDALANDATLHAGARAMGTGSVTTVTTTGRDSFLVRASDALRELDAMLAGLR